MKKEWAMFFFSVTITVIAALVLIRWLAPGLLGIPIDLQLVQTAKEVPPFFDGVFRQDDLASSKLILEDPRILVRAHPLFPDMNGVGPNDILGFRNRSVPNMADVVIIGDSQTYGNNASLENNWPEQLRRMLGKKEPEIYSMAVGGWSAVPYLYIFSKATAFRPRVVIVAFYSGNDSLESFKMVYGMEEWKPLIPDHNLTKRDMPKVNWPPPKSEWWPVSFADGVRTTFTPALRLTSNMDHPVVKAGYKIMAEVAGRISKMAEPFDIELIFTIIPTKELVYSRKVQQDNLNPPDDYRSLVENESENIKWLKTKLSGFRNARYVDVVSPLQNAALEPVALYKMNMNGHPIAFGYGVIAKALLQDVDRLLPEKPNGLVLMKTQEDKARYLLVKDEGVWLFKSLEIAKANEWPVEEVPVVESKDIARLPRRGVINGTDLSRFSPRAMHKFTE